MSVASNNGWMRVSKCELLRKRHIYLKFPFRMCSTDVWSSANGKDLVVYVSDRLSFLYHVDVISRKAHLRKSHLSQSFACKDIEFQMFLFSVPTSAQLLSTIVRYGVQI